VILKINPELISRLSGLQEFLSPLSGSNAKGTLSKSSRLICTLNEVSSSCCLYDKNEKFELELIGSA